MIRIQSIHIEEFRGIRNLDLNLDQKNFGISGPNGTGKSGVVDAIEFCLTGDVTRLSGQGSGELSVKSHAPHVDQSNSPEKATVTITAVIPSLNKTVTITRSVKNPKKATILPNDADARAILDELQSHPEFALSRREIVKYVITPPGQRSTDVQTLLRLEHLDKLRKAFTTFNNSASRESDAAERAKQTAEADFKSCLDLQKLDRPIVLEKINEKRKILGLEPILELKKETAFKEGLPSELGNKEGKKIVKATASNDIATLQASLKSPEPDDLISRKSSAKILLEKLKADKKLLTRSRQINLVRTGLDLMADNSCPLCDKDWGHEDLKEYLSGKLLAGQEASQELATIKSDLNVILQEISVRSQAMKRALAYQKALNLEETEPLPIEGYIKELESIDSDLRKFIEDPENIDGAISVLEKTWWLPAKKYQDEIDKCSESIAALPDTSAEDSARDTLIVAQDRYRKLLETSITAKEKKSESEIAQKVFDYYSSSCTKVLEQIYEKVAEDFSNYYRVINKDDESDFIGKLKSSPAKLNFDVDFYGRGAFPPGAYHSEGHQDGMGLCLYLALMKHTLGEKFTFAVLDDVLMSVDSGHRRDVCRLLKSEFPNTQFVLTTHDKVWLQYMKTEGLISRSQIFGGWTVDLGPRVWHDQDIWEEIEAELKKGDVSKAAWLLRRYLEYTANVLADNFRAHIEFRGDGHYDLGDLMPPTLKEWKKKLEQAEKSAAAWGKTAEKDVLFTRRETIKDLIAKTKSEEWAINPSVHFNEWTNFQPHEFREVVEAFKSLLASLRCDNEKCGSYLYLTPRKGSAEAIRCNCGTTNINLKLK